MTGDGLGRRPTRWPSCGQAWVALLGHVLATGEPALDDRGDVLEGAPVLFQITGFSRADPLITRHGRPDKMALYDRKFTEDAICPPFKYSYGARLRTTGAGDQLAWVTALLTTRPHSKSGWLSLTVPGERPDAVPCLAAVAMRLRGGMLHMSAVFRSQNAFTAYLNYLPLHDVQADVARRLGVPCGPMRVYVDVPHLYATDVTEARAILRAVTPRTGRDRESQVPSAAGRFGRYGR